jgi:glycosyltransferase involved in cell wall biosynthesis
MKVLIVGDSPRINTGFARVNREAANAFLAAGYEVAAVQGLTDQPPPPDYSDGIKYYTPASDDNMMGTKATINAYNDFSPDFVYTTCDPGGLVGYASLLPDDAKVLPYVPIEGEPIPNQFWRIVLSNIDVITCSKYGSDTVKKYLNRDIPWVYHGVDHSIFRKLDNRDEIREAIGWKDKFVVMCVANNVRRKQIPRLIEAMKILKEKYKRKDIYLYLHMVPFQGHWLEGHNLMEIAAMYDVGDIVLFNSKMKKLHDSIPEYTGMAANPGLVELYNAADLFVLPSQVEGFGLPIAEAMACGTPVMVTRYAAGWEVASPAGKGIPVRDWEVHKSGTLYANVNPEAIANEINNLYKNPKELSRMSALGLERVKDFQWNKFHETIVSNSERIIHANA